MDIRQLAELRLQTGYTFEDGTPFYEKLGEERAAALLRRCWPMAIASCPSGN
jgi:hypothetical protein